MIARIKRVANWSCGELTAKQKRITQVILDEISSLPREPAGLQMPSDSQALRVAHALVANLADSRRAMGWLIVQNPF